jgi:AcrR family transcriptional regulator
LVPKLWTDTIDAHRAAIRDAALDATAALVSERGLAGVTMSQIAGRAGIGRATLYKYFPDVQSVLAAWHERQVASHLRDLADAAAGDGRTVDRVERVLRRYALTQLHSSGHQHGDVAALLHQGAHVTGARQQLHTFVAGVLEQTAREGQVRGDVGASELAAYCLHALTAAAGLNDLDAVDRLVAVTMAGLRPHGSAPPA